MKKLVMTVAAAGMLAAGLAASPGAAAADTTAPGATSTRAPEYSPPPIAWGQCASASLQQAGAQCGLLTVPLDYAKPHGAKIKIAVSRIMHKTSDANAQGVMLVNPGGPGGSGLGLARLGAFVPDHGGDPYDWIGFDPRGVGSSQPSLSCDGAYFGGPRPYFVPETAALRQAWWDKTRQYARDCGAAGGALLGHMKTTDVVSDMESIRKALGAGKINYYGFSYGTYLGQVYSTLHPDRVRRMVWDGVVNPVDVWYDANLNQDIQFDKNIKIYFDWIAKHDDVYHLGTDGAAIEELYYSIQQQLRRAPVRHARPGRVERHLRRGGLLRLRLGGRRPGVRGRRDRRPRPGPRLLRRPDRSWRGQQLRQLPGGPVHRRPVAAGLGQVGQGQLGAAPDLAVPDLEQRLVQRALPLLARPRGHAGQRQRCAGPGRAAHRGDQRRGHAVGGCDRGA